DAGAGIELAHVDHFGERQRRLQLIDAALDETLLLAGGVVLGVLLEVAVRARLGDRLHDARALDRLQPIELFAQAFDAALGQWGSSHACSSRWSSWSALTRSESR